MGKNALPDGLPLNTDADPPFLLLFQRGVPVAPFESTETSSPDRKNEMDRDAENGLAPPSLGELFGFLLRTLPAELDLVRFEAKAMEVEAMLQAVKAGNAAAQGAEQLIAAMQTQLSTGELRVIEQAASDVRGAMERCWADNANEVRARERLEEAVARLSAVSAKARLHKGLHAQAAQLLQQVAGYLSLYPELCVAEDALTIGIATERVRALLTASGAVELSVFHAALQQFQQVVIKLFQLFTCMCLFYDSGHRALRRERAQA
jgi:hypothetical protein